MRIKKRLVVCLDGTWNTRDDTTNVAHHFDFALKGVASDGVKQKKYYDEGVGTGVLDGITGGGLGLGLEENVRQAYDWLIEHYQDDAGDGLGPDEVYIFGFSRGAYTARSLVGFISTCGLLRRGSPMSVNQLWADYCTLGRDRENHSSMWDKIYGAAPTAVRRITDLVRDSWNIKGDPAKQPDKPAKTDENAEEDLSEPVPGQRIKPDGLCEQLLVRWSRRIKITYLGVYDTVGAMGIDALAIPGIRSKLAAHHNMRVSSILQKCRHALAVDENRASFAHTPFVEFIGHGTLAAGEANPWTETRRKWWDRIEQRWFIGAHSNVGGGYPNNVLAQRALKWLLEGARAAQLDCEPMPRPVPAILPSPEDSYADFVKPLWAHIIRGKRWFRPIDPEPEIRASRQEDAAGYSLPSINEQVDESVLRAMRESDTYRPPNVIGYARRVCAGATNTAATAEWQTVSQYPARHDWAGTGWISYLMLVLWASFGAMGLVALDRVFAVKLELKALSWLLPVAAVFLVLVDWRESRANYRLALGSNPRRRAIYDAAYWARSFGFLFFVFGAAYALWQLWQRGWHAGPPCEVQDEIRTLVGRWWVVPAVSAVTAALANGLDAFLDRDAGGTGSGKRHQAGIVGGLAGLAATVAVVPAVILLAWIMGAVCTQIWPRTPWVVTPPGATAQFAGLLLLLQIAFVSFLVSFRWVGEPTMRARLGTIVPLQLCFTAGGVAKLLRRWHERMRCRWDAQDDLPGGRSACALRHTLHEAIWRDLVGFIPLYTAVLIYALWFAARHLHWGFLDCGCTVLPPWLLLPLVAAVADVIEDLSHRHYLICHEKGRPVPGFLPPIAWIFTMVKFAAFFSSLLLMVGAMLAGAIHLAEAMPGSGGWRGALALLVTVVVILGVLVVAVSAPLLRLRANRPKDTGC